MNLAQTASADNSDGKRRRKPSRDEWMMLFVTATAFVIFVGGYLLVALNMGCRGDLMAPPPDQEENADE